tara:strand:+ start:699 stop:1007 length:309 start_codon:yes stop_codon:yes gene_type:complete
MDAVTIGGHLRAARHAEEGLSLPRLGREIGVSYGLLGQIERGEQTPDIGVLWLLCARLEALSSDDFIALVAHLDNQARLKIDLERLPEIVRGQLVAVLAKAL